jgi:hypothetical protein
MNALAIRQPCRQRVTEQAPLEDLDERDANLAVLGALQPAVLDPDRRFFDKAADIDDRQRRQYTDH